MQTSSNKVLPKKLREREREKTNERKKREKGKCEPIWQSKPNSNYALISAMSCHGARIIEVKKEP